MPLKSLREVETLLLRQFERQMADRLTRAAFGPLATASEATDEAASFTVTLGRVTEAEAVRDLRGLKAEVARLRAAVAERAGWTLADRTQHFRSIGLRAEMPASLTVASTEALLRGLRTPPVGLTAWQTAQARLQTFATLFAVHTPEAWREAAVLFRSLKLLFPSDTTDQTFDPLLRTLHWFERNTQSGLYPRALPIEGVDSKWLEKQAARLTRLWNFLTGENVARDDFFERVGLLRLPLFVRVKNGATWVGDTAGEEVAMLPVATLAKKSPSSSVVFIIENEQTALSLSVPGVPVFFGLGYGVSTLEALPWLKEKTILYFGDLDTHGLAILAECRRLFPKTRSILTNPATFEAWRDLAVPEPRQALRWADTLTDEEAALGKQLLRKHLRLEQERIPLAAVEKAVEEALTALLKAPLGD